MILEIEIEVIIEDLLIQIMQEDTEERNIVVQDLVPEAQDQGQDLIPDKKIFYNAFFRFFTFIFLFLYYFLEIFF